MPTDSVSETRVWGDASAEGDEWADKNKKGFIPVDQIPDPGLDPEAALLAKEAAQITGE